MIPLEYPMIMKYEQLGTIVDSWETHKPTNSKARKRNLERLAQQYEYEVIGKGKGTQYNILAEKKQRKRSFGRVKRIDTTTDDKKTVHRTYKEMVYIGGDIDENTLVPITDTDYKVHRYIDTMLGDSCYYSYIQLLEVMKECPYDTNINWDKYKQSTNSHQKQLAYVHRFIDLQELYFTTDNEKIIVYKTKKRNEPLQFIDKRLKLTNFKKRQLDIGILMATITDVTDSLRVVKTLTDDGGGVVVYIKATDLFEDVGLINDSFKRNRKYVDYLEDYLPREEQSLIYSHIHLSARNSVDTALRRLKRSGAISTHIYTYIMVTDDNDYIGLNNEQAVIIDKALEKTVNDMVKQFPHLDGKCERGADFYQTYTEEIEKFKWKTFRTYVRQYLPNYKSHMRAFGIGMVDTKVKAYLNKRAEEENMDLDDYIDQQHLFTHLESTNVMTRSYNGTSEKAQKRKALVESCTVETSPTHVKGFPFKELTRLASELEHYNSKDINGMSKKQLIELDEIIDSIKSKMQLLINDYYMEQVDDETIALINDFDFSE